MTRILIIEDDEEMCTELNEILNGEGYFVQTCFNGERGIGLAGEAAYDIVLLDLKLPGMSGYEVLKRLKNEYPRLKVLILTGSPLPNKYLPEEEFISSSGYDDIALESAEGVINKPFDIEQLLETIKKLI